MTVPSPAPAVEIVEVQPDSSDALHCLARYYAEIADRFDSGFDPVLSSAPSLDQFAPPSGTFLVVGCNGALVGCGGFKRDTDDAAYLKRMWVAPEARGLGLGKLLLRALEEKARALGYRTIRLKRNNRLPKRSSSIARQVISRSRPSTTSFTHHWFEKVLA